MTPTATRAPVRLQRQRQLQLRLQFRLQLRLELQLQLPRQTLQGLINFEAQFPPLRDAAYAPVVVYDTFGPHGL